MTDIATLRARYFLDASDAKPPSEPVPQTFAGNEVIPLIDGTSYFTDLAEELEKVGGAGAAGRDEFVLIANWWLGISGGFYQAVDIGGFAGTVASIPVLGPLPSATPEVSSGYPLFLRAGDPPLPALLAQKAQAGVDVRAMGWVSAAVMGSVYVQTHGAQSVAEVNSMTMASIHALRQEPAIGAKAILNTIGHSAGAAHSKLVVVGSPQGAVAYTGGIDLVESRRGAPGHAKDDNWHDLVVKVEGPAVQGLYDWYRQIWNENLRQPQRRFKFDKEKMASFLSGAPQLQARTIAAPNPPVGTQEVQSLRTVPKADYSLLNCWPTTDPVSFAPEGLFEFRAVVRKALRAARSLVYVEDQSFWAQEMLGWVNEAIKARPGLRVILLHSGAADPKDQAFPFSYTATAINHSLLAGLTPAQIGQVRMLRRLGSDLQGKNAVQTQVLSVAPLADTGLFTVATTAPLLKDQGRDQLEAANLFLVSPGGARYPVIGNEPGAQGSPLTARTERPPDLPALAPGPYTLDRGVGVVVHSKVVLVDDECAIVGSANCMRRSLYTDLEQSFAVLEGGDEPFAKRLRTELWADHLGGKPEDYDDLKAALAVWEPAWGNGPRGRPATVRRMGLPLIPDMPMSPKDRDKYDVYNDVDSRESWGGLCPP